MPLPIIVVGIALLFGGTCAAIAIINWDKIFILFSGKTIATLGARRTGKTTLMMFLSTGSIPKVYKMTPIQQQADENRFNLKDLKLKIKKSMDVGGDKSLYPQWKKVFNKADIVLYLLRADKLMARDLDTEERTVADLNQIKGWLEEKGKDQPMFFIIGTHCDLDERYLRLTPDTIASYTDEFRQLPVEKKLERLAGGGSKARVILGSLKDIKSTEVLVYEIFNQAQHD